MNNPPHTHTHMTTFFSLSLECAWYIGKTTQTRKKIYNDILHSENSEWKNPIPMLEHTPTHLPDGVETNPHDVFPAGPPTWEKIII